MGIQIESAGSHSYSFPIASRKDIDILVKHNGSNPIVTIESLENNSTRIHHTFNLKNSSDEFVPCAVNIGEVGDQVVVKIGSGIISDEDDGYYGDLIEPGPVGSVDLRDVKIAGGSPIMDLGDPIYMLLNDSTSPYELVITYKAID